MFILSFLLSLILISPAWAASVTTVSVSSSTAGTQVVSSINGGVIVAVPLNAASDVWFARINGTCSSVLTTQAGVYVMAGNSYPFIPLKDQWNGQICAILQSGSTAVSVAVNPW